MDYYDMYKDDPFFKYTDEERERMTAEEYCALIEESNEYVRWKHSQPNTEQPPKFNTLQELLDYYDAIPFEDAIREMGKLFEQ